MKPWGFHLLLDCSNCDAKLISDPENIKNFSRTLVKRINMIAWDEPRVEFMLPGDVKQGHTLIQLITTSNITAHFVDHDGSAFIDVFSCQEFDPVEVKATVSEFFQPQKITDMLVARVA